MTAKTPMRQRNSLWWIGAGALALLAAAGIDAWAGGGTQPYSLAYQGYLEQDGSARTHTVDLTFGLHADELAATAASWTEQHNGVLVTGGRFAVTLGEAAALSPALLAANPYLSITIRGDGGVPVTPAVVLKGRQLLTATPYAHRGAPGQDFVVDGRVAIGRVAAQTTLDVNGEIKPGNLGTPCTANTAGAVRYNTTVKLLEYCDGTLWATIAQTGAPVLAGTFRNLLVTNDATAPDSKAKVQVDGLVLANATNSRFVTVSQVNLVVNLASSGVNGLDTGSPAANRWYHLWVIDNGATTAGLWSLSSTAPTLPAGYSYFARVGAMRRDGTGKLLRTLQRGRRTQYVVTAGSNTANAPLMASGPAGNINTPAYSAVAVAAFVPPTAERIIVLANNQSGTPLMIAPNGAYGNWNSNTNPFPLGWNGANGAASSIMTLNLESSNIYYASSGTNVFVHCYGWEDAI